VAFRLIQPDWQTPPRPPDAVLIGDIFDAMADMEKSVLAFLDPLYGLAYDYGSSNLPENLPEDRYPCVLHVPRGNGTFRSLTTMGGSLLLGHPGGIREHEYPFAIYWLVGHRTEGVDRLMVKSSFWCKAVDMAYSANPGLAGACHEVGLGTSYWGNIDWNSKRYYGWIFNGTVRKQYLFKGAGP